MRFVNSHNYGGVQLFRYDRMNELAKEQGVKKAHLCRLMGKSPYYLRDAEKNKTDIDGENLRIIAEALHTTPEYLSSLSDDPHPETAEPISDTQLKFALFGDTEEIDDADLEDVRRYAAFVKERKKNK